MNSYITFALLLIAIYIFKIYNSYIENTNNITVNEHFSREIKKDIDNILKMFYTKEKINNTIDNTISQAINDTFKNNNILSELDMMTLFNFLKLQNNYRNILLPNIIHYNIIDNVYIMKNIKITFTDNKNNKKDEIVTIKFKENTNNMFIAEWNMFGKNGILTIDNKKVTFKEDMTNESELPIPDMISITTEEIDSPVITTDSEKLLHNSI